MGPLAAQGCDFLARLTASAARELDEGNKANDLSPGSHASPVVLLPKPDRGLGCFCLGPTVPAAAPGGPYPAIPPGRWSTSGTSAAREGAIDGSPRRFSEHSDESLAEIDAAEQQALGPDQHAMGPPALRLLGLEVVGSRVSWTLDARKLESRDKQIVSPPFELAVGHSGSAEFRMMLHPKVVSNERRGGSFAKAKGCGFVQVKSAAGLQDRVALGVTVGTPADRVPVVHDFAESAVLSLPKDGGVWDLRGAVDRETRTLTIVLDLDAEAAPSAR